MAILIAGIVALQFAHSPSWLSILLASLLTLDAVVFFIAFLYLMFKRPHSLRSESFDYKMTELIQKRADEMRAGLYEELPNPSNLDLRAGVRSEESEGEKQQ